MNADTASFSKIENELEHEFRNRVNSAEAARDVEQAFAAFLAGILSRVTGGEVVLDEGDVRVAPELADGYALGPGITANAEYARILEHSDLPVILRRQARDAVNRINHLGRHTIRAEAKIFPRPDRKF